MSEAEYLPSPPASAAIGHLSDAQLHMLWLRLRGDDVPYSVSGTSLVGQGLHDRLALTVVLERRPHG